MPRRAPPRPRARVTTDEAATIAARIKAAKKPVILMGGSCTQSAGIAAAARVSAAGVRILIDTFVARHSRGAGRFAPATRHGPVHHAVQFDAAAYARYRDRLPPFHFGQKAVEIRFPASMLDEPIATADPVSVQLAIERCEQEMSRQAAASGTRGQVVERLRCEGGRYPELAEVAEQLHVSERTLKRHLQAEGCSFQALLDEVRQRDAERLLANPQLAIKQVADAVGYADPANFARAFGKWTGLSPKAWRDRLAASRGPK